jgi:HD-GYP domain-containing protein (c-di-GMP phosphodiesterase class II)
MVAPEYEAELQGALERTGGIELLGSLGEALPYEREHCKRVGSLAMHVVSESGGRPEEVIEAGSAGMLHDIGKIDPRVQALISLDCDLSPEEKEQVNQIHTTLGASMISRLQVSEEDEGLIKVAGLVALYHHHEPRDLLDLADVPSVSMIRRIQIIDKFDAMQDIGRPYHKGNPLTPEEALSDIELLLRSQMAFDNLAHTTMQRLRTA